MKRDDIGGIAPSFRRPGRGRVGTEKGVNGSARFPELPETPRFGRTLLAKRTQSKPMLARGNVRNCGRNAGICGRKETRR